MLKLILAACLCWTAVSRAAQIFEPAAEFSITENPHGVWSYGYSTTLGGDLLPFNGITPAGAVGPLDTVGLEGWYLNNFYRIPSVLHNPTSDKVSNTGANVSSVEAGGLALHPGEHGEYAVLRFTAPQNASYSIAGSFFGDNNQPTSTDVHVLVNGGSIYDAVVQGFGPTSAQTFSASRQLARGDVVEFAVGVGPDGSFGSDLTGLNLAITQTTGAFDAKSDFSAANNPNGAWTFGQSPALDSGFTPFTSGIKRNALDYWAANAVTPDPGAGHNPDKFPQLLNEILFQPHELVLHPGPSGEFAIARWTAPSAGKFLLQSTFVGEGGVSTTDVHVRQNGLGLFDGAINGRGKRATYSSIITVATGDTIDFAVAYGSDQNYASDTTGLDVQLRPITQTDSTNLTTHSAIQVAWPLQSGVIYQLQVAQTVDAATWLNAGPPFVDPSFTNIFTLTTNPKLFYRLITYK